MILPIVMGESQLHMHANYFCMHVEAKAQSLCKKKNIFAQLTPHASSMQIVGLASDKSSKHVAAQAFARQTGGGQEAV